MRVLLPLASLLGFLTSAWGQQPTASPYIGSSACEECHKQVYRRFSSTKMAKVFFDAPRNELEAKGCEACHGAGREHAEAAREHDRAREKGVVYQGPPSGQFILKFGKDSPLSVREQNGRCLQCHEKGKRMFWDGSSHEARGLSCVRCHQV